MPYAIEEVQLPEAEKRGDKVLFKVLLALNIIFPALETVVEIIGFYANSKTGELTWFYFGDYMTYFVAIIQFVSGYLLIQGLNKIRTFIDSR